MVHPDQPDDKPGYIFKRVWITALEAAFADAYSTASLLMSEEEVNAFADSRRDDAKVFVEVSGGVEIRCILD